MMTPETTKRIAAQISLLYFSLKWIPRFCCMAAVPRENWGMAQTRLAIMAAMSQPQPSTGLTCLLMAWKGFSPVESVT